MRILIFLSLCMILGCNSHQTIPNEIITINVLKGLKVTHGLKLSDFAKDIEYIKLETKISLFDIPACIDWLEKDFDPSVKVKLPYHQKQLVDQIRTIDKCRIINNTGMLRFSEIQRLKLIIRQTFVD